MQSRILAETSLESSLFHLIDNRHLVKHFAYVGGRWAAARDGAVFQVTDPADGSLLGEVTSLSGAAHHFGEQRHAVPNPCRDIP